MTVRFRGALPEHVSATAAFDAATTLGGLVRVHYGAPCTIVINANRRQILSRRRRAGHVTLSVHWALVPHADDVMAWIRDVPGAVNRLRAHLPTDGSARPAARTVTRSRGTEGEVHDLQPFLDAERKRWPDCPPELFVEWGDWPKVAPRRVLRLGSCLPPRIRIHPVLDAKDVPGWFIGFIVFHEVLHVEHPPRQGPTGRRQIHHRVFRNAERAHPDHDRAVAFERAHIDRFLARCRAQIRRGAR